MTTASTAPAAPTGPSEEEAITLAELELIAATEAFLAAGAKFAEFAITPDFYVGEGYRILFGGPQVYQLQAA
jgi:hypothetical protein